METILSEKSLLELSNRQYRKYMPVGFFVALAILIPICLYWEKSNMFYSILDAILLIIYFLLTFKLSSIFPSVKFRYLKKLLEHNKSTQIDLCQLKQVINWSDWSKVAPSRFFKKNIISDPIEFISEDLIKEYIESIFDFKKNQETLKVKDIEEAVTKFKEYKNSLSSDRWSRDYELSFAIMIIADNKIKEIEKIIQDQIEKREALTKEIEGLLQAREYQTTFQG